MVKKVSGERLEKYGERRTCSGNATTSVFEPNCDIEPDQLEAADCNISLAARPQSARLQASTSALMGGTCDGASSLRLLAVRVLRILTHTGTTGLIGISTRFARFLTRRPVAKC